MSVRVAAVALAFLLANEARADQLACSGPKEVAAAKAKIDAANAKAKTAALTAAGLTPIKVGPASSVKPVGNVVTVDVPQSCDVEPWNMVQFVVDKNKKAYRLVAKITKTDVGVFACGKQTCPPPCGAPDYDIPMSFKLPDNVVYSGEREVAWTEQVALVSYDMPVECTAGGQARTPAGSPTGTSELEKLKAENTKLRTENAELKKKLELYKALEAREKTRLEKEQKKLSKELK